MSLQSRLLDLVSAIGADIKALDAKAPLVSPAFTGAATLNGDSLLALGAANTQRALPLNKAWTWAVPDGTPIYSSPIFVADFPIASIGFRGPVIIFQGYDWWIYCMNAITGVYLWRKATGGPCYGRCQAADVNGDGELEVFGSSHDGHIWALNSSGGNLYQFPNLYEREGGSVAPLSVTAATATAVTISGANFVPNCFVRSTTATANNSSLTVTSGTGAGQTKKIKSNTATVITTVAFSPALDATSKVKVVPAYADDVIYQHAGTLSQESGTWYLYITGSDFQVVKIIASSGAIVWRYSTLEAIEPYPLVMDINQDGALEVLAASVDGNVYCLNASTGALNWKTQIGDALDGFLSAADVDADGIIEVALTGRDNMVHLLNGNTGALKWSSVDFGGDGDTRPLLVNELGTYYIYTANDSGTIAKLDSQLNRIWQINTGAATLNASPILVAIAADGSQHVVFSTMRGELLFVKPNGVLTGCLFVKGSIEGTPWFEPTITAYGGGTPSLYRALFVPSLDGYMTCYADTSSTPVV